MISQPPELAGSRNLDATRMYSSKMTDLQQISSTVQEVGSQKNSFFIPSTIQYT